MNQIAKGRTFGVAVLFLAAASLIQATPIQATITFDNPSVPSLGDGSYYVGPALIEIDTTALGGGVTQQLVMCYDTHDEANFGDAPWTANLFNITDASNLGYFSVNLAGYEEVAWLSSQTPTNDAERIGLQEAIWGVFGTPTAVTGDNLTAENTYLTAATTAAAGGYAGFDFSTFVFVEQAGPTPGSVAGDPREQAFVYRGSIPVITHQTPQTPEPGTTFLVAGGIGLLGLLARRKARA